MKFDRRAIRLLFPSTLLIASLTLPAIGQRLSKLPALPPSVRTGNDSSVSAPPAFAPAAMTAEDVAAFLDGVVPLQLKRENIAGAVVLVVKDGKVLYSKGYGYSDVKTRTPMSADGNLVRVGSVSKLFTWTAVMQLVQQHKIDLDQDVNTYLDFKIPATYAKPITMRNLMTHTAGFEEVIQDLIGDDPKQIIPLGTYVKEHLPERVFAPGTTPAYSNYGAAIAGYIVQRVSGMPFDEYVEKNIFDPLQMQHATFRQPLPETLKPMMSKAYDLASEPSKPFEIVIPAPAGSVSATAENMSHLMIAHLQGGEYNGQRILSQDTANLMHSRQYAPNPAVNAMCLGFYEEKRNGQRIIGHAGDTDYFHTDLHLMLDDGVGFFVSYNSRGTGEISPRTALWNQFLDRYYPYTIPAAHPPANAIQDAKLVAGQYTASRGAFTTVLSFIQLAGQLTVTAMPDGDIVTDSFKTLAGQPERWQEIAPLVYRLEGGQDLIAFNRSPQGRLRASIDFPFEVFDRASFLDGKSFNLFLIFFTVIVGLLAFLAWPVAAWTRRHYRRSLVLTARQRTAYFVVHLVGLLDVIFLAGWVVILTELEKNPGIAGASLHHYLRLLQVIGWVGTLGTLAVIYAVYLLRDAENRWWLARVGYGAVVLACVSFSWLVYHWHLLHWSLRF